MKKTFLFLCCFIVAFCTADITKGDHGQSRVATDPAFDRFVSQAALEHAQTGRSPSQMIDTAARLSEGERALGRPHMGGTASSMLQNAYRAAVVNNDTASQDRAKTVARTMGQNLGPQFDQIHKQVTELQNNVPKFQNATTPTSQAYTNTMVQEAHHAFLNNDVGALRRLQKQTINNYGEPVPDPLQAEINTFLEGLLAKLLHQDNNNPPPPQRNNPYYGWGDNRPDTPPPPPPADPNNDPNGWNNSGYGNGYGDGNGGNWGSNNNNGAYSSRMLGAAFAFDPRGARIVNIYPGSPLSGRLNVGDVITYLDSLPVSSSRELENHFNWTTVDYLINGNYSQRTQIFIRP